MTDFKHENGHDYTRVYDSTIGWCWMQLPDYETYADASQMDEQS